MSVAIVRTDPIVGAGFGNVLRMRFNCTFSGSYTAGGSGDILDFTSSTANVEGTSQPPALIIGPNVFAGYILEFIRGTALNNSSVKVWVTGSASGDVLNELASGSYPAALTAGPFKMEVIFNKF